MADHHGSYLQKAEPAGQGTFLSQCNGKFYFHRAAHGLFAHLQKVVTYLRQREDAVFQYVGKTYHPGAGSCDAVHHPFAVCVVGGSQVLQGAVFF